MTWYLLLLTVILFSCTFAVKLPALYSREKKRAIIQCEDLKNEMDNIGVYPLAAVCMLLIPVSIFYFSQDILLSSYLFFLAIVSYTDLSARWIPDSEIYFWVALSVYSLRDKDTVSQLLSAAFFILPALILHLYGYLVKKEIWIASGDFYVIPTIGIMVLPEYAATLMLVALVICIAVTRWIPKIPFVTVLFFVFSGYQVLILSGAL
ncbi:hypothetical protein FKR03_21885 [Salmonella enterica]|nr:hypothetical protein [Salmonella enterica]EEB3252780.1 hypothetical protein [Salmonella enterica]